jgi:hypothetical protein
METKGEPSREEVEAVLNVSKVLLKDDTEDIRLSLKAAYSIKFAALRDENAKWERMAECAGFNKNGLLAVGEELQKRDEQLMTDDQLPEMDTWGLSPKGFVVYFDFPHVMAVFDKTVVPYGMLARHLSPTGVVPIVR